MDTLYSFDMNGWTYSYLEMNCFYDCIIFRDHIKALQSKEYVFRKHLATQLAIMTLPTVTIHMKYDI